MTSQSPEVITGPVLIRDGITYHQDTNELVTGIVEEFYDNGQLRWRTNFIDGKENGLQELFYENGQLEWRGNWRDGDFDGLSEYFDRNGNLTVTSTYRNGELVE